MKNERAEVKRSESREELRSRVLELPESIDEEGIDEDLFLVVSVAKERDRPLHGKDVDKPPDEIPASGELSNTSVDKLQKDFSIASRNRFLDTDFKDVSKRRVSRGKEPSRASFRRFAVRRHAPAGSPLDEAGVVRYPVCLV